jgi:hypothetical protein
MAPEQALAKRDLDQRVDVYAAGAMFYEMITGVVAFDAPSEAELLMEIAYRMRDLMPPSAIVPTIPKALDGIVFKAMAKEREQRYQNANAFSEALNPFIETPPANTGDSTGKLKIHLKPAAIEGRPSAPTKLTDETGELRAATADELPTHSAKPMVFGIAALFLAGAGIATFAVINNHHDARPVAANHGAQRMQPPADQRAAPTPPAPPSTPIVDAHAHIDLENVPDDAVVTLDDHAESSRHLTLDRGTSHSLRVQAPGRQQFVTNFVADRDRSIVIAMLPDTPAAPERPVATGGTGTAPRNVHPAQGAASNPSSSGATHTNTPRDHARSITSPLPVSTEF